MFGLKSQVKIGNTVMYLNKKVMRFEIEYKFLKS